MENERISYAAASHIIDLQEHQVMYRLNNIMTLMEAGHENDLTQADIASFNKVLEAMQANRK